MDKMVLLPLSAVLVAAVILSSTPPASCELQSLTVLVVLDGLRHDYLVRR